VELPEVHSGIERRNLVAVAVEHQRLAPEELAEAALAALRPARMIDLRIDVRVEAVLRGLLLLPRVERLVFNERHPHDRLDALEAVLPRKHEADRRAILVWQHFAVEAEPEQRQRMHHF